MIVDYCLAPHRACQTWRALVRTVPLCAAVSLATGVGAASADAAGSGRSWHVAGHVPLTPRHGLASPLRPGPWSIRLGRAAALGATPTPSINTSQLPDYVGLTAEFKDRASCQAFALRGAHVLTRFDRFVDLLLPWGAEAVAESLRADSNLQCVERTGVVQLPPQPPPPIREPLRAPPVAAERIVQGGLDGLTGRGVLIAILDSGVDFRNPDFIAVGPDGRPESRIVAMWDLNSDLFQRRRLGSRPPVTLNDGTPIGTVFDRATLTRALRTNSRDIPATDLIGHGTACAGIAAGNGRSMPDQDLLRGVAPNADLIVVRLCQGDCSGMAGAFLGAACAWADSIARALNRPLVVSCSFGTHLGPHDGSTVSERELEARFPEQAVGRALCVAAGNEGQDPIHTRMTFRGPADTVLVRWEAPSGRALINLYPRAGVIDDLELLQVSFVGVEQAKIQVDGAANACGDMPAHVGLVSEGTVGGIGIISASPREVDLYVLGGALESDLAQPDRMVSRPGTCRAALTVGSYIWNATFDQLGTGLIALGSMCSDNEARAIGGPSCFSSRGATQNGKVKPDVLGPGQAFSSTLARTLDGAPVGIELDEKSKAPLNLHGSGKARLFRGTSAATPYVAGVLALALEKNPHLTWGTLKALVRSHATEDALTGAAPNAQCGYGKLDLAAAKAILADREVVGAGR